MSDSFSYKNLNLPMRKHNYNKKKINYTIKQSLHDFCGKLFNI